MKKSNIITFLFCIIFLCLLVHPIQAEGDTLSADNTYHVVNVNKKGEYKIIKSSNRYAQAKDAYNTLKSKYHNLSITYGDSFLFIEQGVVSFKTASDCSLNIEYDEDNSNESGYLNGCYGGDGAFLDYNSENGMVKFKISGVIGWANGVDVAIYPRDSVPSVSSFIVKKNVLYHRIKSSATAPSYANSISLSSAPSYLKHGITYYSYDSHYFYTSFHDMIQDYRSGTFKKSINKNEPYYNYYQYMNHRSTSSYSSKQLNTYFKETLAMKRSMKHFDGIYIHNILTQSLLYQNGDAFFQYQNQFGANALMMLSLSMNESAMGRSYLAYTKNNLFGHAAYDSSAQESASRYVNVGASVYSHAMHYISNSYLNPDEFQFHGGFFGNKAGGMNVSYASDPYWGEKAAHYYYTIDQAMGSKDYNNYALAISERDGINVYKHASSESDVLYHTVDGYDSALIVLDKVKNKDGSFYRVQTDISLQKDKTKVEDGTYSYKNSIGYVRAKDIDTLYNPNKIDEKSYVNITFHAVDGLFYPDTSTISMQVETGMTPVIIAPEKDHALFDGWDITLESATVNLTYNATYKEVKSIQLVEKPKTSYRLNEPIDIRGGTVRVNFKNGKSKEYELTSDMIPETTTNELGTKTINISFAGCTTNYEINISNELEQKEQELLERASYIIKTYSGKTGLSSEGMDELVRFRNDIEKMEEDVLSIEQLRAIDRILQANLKPQYSVLIKDDTYDLQISGISLALQSKINVLHKIMPKTIEVKLNDGVSKEDEDLFKKVAKANNMTISSMISIDGKDDFSSLKPNRDIVFSIQKPKSNKSQRNYRVYYKDGDNVHQLTSSQSESRIVFSSSKLGSFAIVYQTSEAVNNTQDFNEVNTIKQNGKNYIMTYIILPCCILLILFIIMVSFVVYRKKHPSSKCRSRISKKASTEEKKS